MQPMRAAALAFALVASIASAQSPAQRLLTQAMEALGGRERLLSIQKVSTQAIGHSYLLEQSDRYEGPYLVSYLDIQNDVDFPSGTIAQKGRARGALFENWIDFSGDMKFNLTGPPTLTGRRMVSIGESKLRYAIGPERLLFIAEAAKDLHTLKPATLQKTPQDVLGFKWGDAPTVIYLNAYTHLPTAVDVTWQGEGFWGVFGDVTTRTLFSNWSLQPGGLHFPLLWNVERNGKPAQELTITKVDVTYGAADTTSTPLLLAIAPKLPANPMRVPPYKEIDVAPGIVQYSGGFNTTVVDQGDGLVFIEGVSSSEYMADILAAAQKRFPGKPVKGVITTTDAWPHIGGLREFVARGIPVYALKENEAILTDLVRSHRTYMPDTLQEHPATPKFHWITTPQTLGKTNHLVIAPIRGEGAERMLMVYFPDKKLLYGSDLVQPMSDGSLFFLQYPDELRAAVERERFAVDTVFAMHATPRPWSRVLEAIQQGKAMP